MHPSNYRLVAEHQGNVGFDGDSVEHITVTDEKFTFRSTSMNPLTTARERRTSCRNKGRSGKIGRAATIVTDTIPTITTTIQMLGMTGVFLKVPEEVVAVEVEMIMMSFR
jgi:hypothetical protein